jgi:nucleoside-diphosphate-sugar epimerase
MSFPRAAHGKRIFYIARALPDVSRAMSAARSSQEDLEKKRTDKSVRIFMTGGTGFLGSHVAVELLRRGYRVCLLARSGKQRSAEDRVKELLDWFGLPAEGRQGLRVVEGDITRQGLGIDPAVFRELALETDEIIHCASNTSFAERKRAEVEAVNADGLSHVLDFARAGLAYFFHHVSTAFVAGKTTGICPEEPVTAREFFNAYEETKCRGEQMALAACQEAGLGLTIYRPSIVYGDSRTGRSLLFNAVYYPVKTALFMKDLYEKDIREKDGRKAEEMGVHIEADGSIHLPIRICVAERGGLNLIPVDYFTDAFLAIMEDAPQGGIFHIVNRKQKRIEDIIDYSCRLFRMTGIRACSSAEFEKRTKNPLESLYDHYLKAYDPYMRDKRDFETTKSQPILERRGLVCPEFDYVIFSKCMNYAVETGWGSRLFSK